MESVTQCLVSACLTGLCTRYDGKIKHSSACEPHLTGRLWIPICPEQLGGLATPREAADLVGGDGQAVLEGHAKVVTHRGVDVTQAFILGANQCLLIAKAQNIRLALLKSRSPSCGLHPRIGVTAALLSRHGIQVIELD
jgi:uncharacterized protein YbbK (DUF523 family)